MKSFTSILFAFFAFATVVFAQDVQIGYPPAGSKVKPGQHLTVEIDQPVSLHSHRGHDIPGHHQQNSIQGSWNVGVAIGASTCASGNPTCLPASDGMNIVLYNGPYNPEQHTPSKPRYQSFTVVVPSWFPKGPAQLNVAYAGLFGVRSFPAVLAMSSILHISPSNQANAFPYFQTINQTLTVV